MAVSGVTQLSGLIPEIWSENFYEELRSKLIISQVFSREYEGEIKTKGDTVRVNQINKPTGEMLTDDTTEFNSEALSTTQFSVVADRRANAAFEFTDLAMLQSISFESQAIEALTRAVAEQIEDFVIGLLVPSAAAPDHTVAPASAGDLAAADVAGLRTLLSLQSVPTSDRWLFLDPNYFGDIIQKSTFSSSDFIPVGSPTATGALASPLYGFKVSESDHLGTDIGYAVHKSALQLVMQKGMEIKVSDLHSNNKHGFLMSASVVLGASLFDNKRIIKISG